MYIHTGFSIVPRLENIRSSCCCWPYLFCNSTFGKNSAILSTDGWWGKVGTKTCSYQMQMFEFENLSSRIRMMVENFESFKNLQYWIRKKLRKKKTYNFFLLQRSALSNALGGACPLGSHACWAARKSPCPGKSVLQRNMDP